MMGLTEKSYNFDCRVEPVCSIAERHIGRSLQNPYYFIASSTATATATVAPTIGLLPIPIRPIISTYQAHFVVLIGGCGIAETLIKQGIIMYITFPLVTSMM